MGNMFQSAVFKLTAAYLAIAMAISVAFSAVLYRLATQELQTGFHNQYMRWFSKYQPFGLRSPTNPAAELLARSQHIFEQLVYFNILVLLLTGIASYLLARRTLRPIEIAHEQQKRFTADVSHELRTPLTSLKMETEVALLDKKASNDALRTTLESNLEEATRMENLINNLLQLTTLEADKVRNDFTPLNISDVLNSAVQVVKKYADTKHVTLQTSHTQAVVIGDKTSLTQLFVILLDNAIKYSPEGSTVTVEAKPSSNHVAVIIRDTGIGIDAEALPHIFDRFYRADKARRRQDASGFGLGLSLAKLIADLHTAEIVIESTPGKGTTATVNLPTLKPPKPRKPKTNKS